MRSNRMLAWSFAGFLTCSAALAACGAAELDSVAT